MVLDLILVGFGNVARRFVTLVDEQRRRLARDHDVTLRIVGIATGRHGQLFSPHGIDARTLADVAARGDQIGVDRARGFLARALWHSRATARGAQLIVVETTTLDIRHGQPAIAHVRAALSGGAHVVTANKGPAAFAYRVLSRAAVRANRRFLFEGAVMDGIPVFNLVRETLPGVAVRGFRGVINTTTNYILHAVEQGQDFDAALRAMQAAGIAEADPTLDVDGWDAAVKTAALANVLLGADMTPHAIARQGRTPDIARQAREARRHGRRVKLVARASVRNGLKAVPKITASVAPEELPDTDLLATLDAEQNALILETDLLGEIAIVQRGGGLTATAYALLSDILTIARAIRPPRRRVPPAGSR